MGVRLGTFNILHGRDYMRYLNNGEEVIDLSKVSAAISDLGLDICGLNEVRNQENVEGLCNQAKVIAENLGYYYVFGRAIDNRGGEYGNALISKYPINDVEFIPISVPEKLRVGHNYYEDRVIIAAKISVDGELLTVLVTHFGLNDDEKDKGVEAILEYKSKCRSPVIFMGDLNIKPDSAYYAELNSVFNDTAESASGNLCTYPSTCPKYKIDYIFCNDKCNVTHAFVPELCVSDHRPYVADITVN